MLACTGVFYYLLGNIRPAFRSSLQAMQLVAIAKASDIHTYGCDSLLQPFVESTNLLARVSPFSVGFATLKFSCNINLSNSCVKSDLIVFPFDLLG